MKIVSCVAAVVAAAALIISAAMAPKSLPASARAPKKDVQFEGSPAWEKADLRLRDAWREATTTGEGDTRFECLMKTRRPVSADDKAILKSAGFDARTVIGDIVTGSVRASDVPQVAALELVRAMELAVPLTIKKKP